MTLAGFLELLTYPFVLRALAVGAMISLCASMLGVVLVLKRYSLIGHGLSEVGFASLSVAAALGLPPLLVATPVVLLASFAILFISQRWRVGGDIAIAVASSSALALGVLATALGPGLNTDVYGILFGSLLATTGEDVAISAGLAFLVLSACLLFYNRLFLITYSEDYARSLGIPVPLYHLLISALTALTVVLGMRMMGSLLISSLIILPAVTARRMAHGFRSLVILSAGFSLLCFFVGMGLSLVWDFPTGASVVLANVGALLLTQLLAWLRGRMH
ncbi:MAG: metal ABC transporter permease [Fretibacterium sp.]|nr:metal ABC transporter permease [Fretibacterium sp.]